MSLSDFSTPRRRVGFRLSGIARRWRQTLDTRLAAADLSDAVWAALVHLYRLGDNVSQTELAAAMGIEGSSLVRLLDMLVAQELIERLPHPSDRRIKLLHLTSAGRTKVTAIRKRLITLEDSLLADLDDKTLQIIVDAFDKIDARIALLHEQNP